MKKHISRITKNPRTVSYLYSAASVFIGPALGILGSRHPSGWDCDDGYWYTEGMVQFVPMKDREAVYDHYALPMAIGAWLMLVLGVTILGWMLYHSAKNKKLLASILPAFLMIFMLLGYATILALAASPWCGSGY